jgi:hypothetical protein
LENIVAAATAERKASALGDIVSVLAEGPMEIKEFIGLVDRTTAQLAWTRGEIEAGTVKYIVAGNPSRPELTHNGVSQAKPAVIIEGGIEWPMPNARLIQKSPLAELLREKLPDCATYEKYQQEVCVSKEKDVWQWLEDGEIAGERETRWARRKISRAEADKMFGIYVRLTEKAMAAVA